MIMEQSPPKTEEFSRPYYARMSTWWWLSRWKFLKFILRELSSLFVAWSVVMILLLIGALSRGPDAYARFQEWLKNPLVIAVNVVSFLFLLFHTISWFNLAPRALALRVRGKRVPDVLIAAPNYVAWLAISAVVAWILLRG
jgi:fumarate reductase subunit C